MIHRTAVIGDGVELGERATVGPGAVLLGPLTVGDDCWIGLGVSLGGHVEVGDRTNIGMNAVVHQRRVIGAGAMVGMGSVVTRDVPPHALVYGNPARLRDVNRVGMSRAGMPDAEIERLAAEYGARSPG